MDNGFAFSSPVAIYFGEGCINKLQEILENYGFSAAVLVADPFFEKFALQLKEKFTFIKETYCKINENPDISLVFEVVDLVNKANADVVIAVGGGSTLDAAKAAGAFAKSRCKGETFFTQRPDILKNGVKVITIPTTAGTGAEVTSAVVLNRGKVKKALAHPSFFPFCCIVDPSLTYSLPPRTTVITGLDALAHAIEAYCNLNRNPISDLYAMQAVSLIRQSLENAFLNGKDKNARRDMSLAALLSGLAFAATRPSASHACSYPLSTDYNMTHGEACAFTLGAFAKINGFPDAEEIAKYVKKLQLAAGLKTSLKDLEGLNLEKLVNDCLAHPLMANNPVKMNEETLKTLLTNLQ